MSERARIWMLALLGRKLRLRGLAQNGLPCMAVPIRDRSRENDRLLLLLQ